MSLKFSANRTQRESGDIRNINRTKQPEFIGLFKYHGQCIIHANLFTYYTKDPFKNTKVKWIFKPTIFDGGTKKDFSCENLCN